MRMVLIASLSLVLPGARAATPQAVVTVGERRVYVAAQAGEGPDLEAQTRRAVARVKAALSAAGAKNGELVRVDANVLGSEDPAVVRRILSQHFPRANRLILPVGALPVPGSLVQIAALAVSGARSNADGVVHLGAAGVSVAQSRGVLYLSGQNDSAVGRHESIADMAELTRRCMQGLNVAVKGGGATMQEVANVVVYMSSLRQLDKVRDVYLSYFAAGKAPAVSYVARSAQDGPVPWVEVDAEAAMPAKVAPPQRPEFLNPEGLAASPVYTYVVRAGTARTLYLGAQPQASPADSQAQAQAIFERFDRMLREAGCGFGDVVKVRSFPVAAKGVMAGINAVRNSFYQPGRPPASTLLGWDSTGIAGAHMQIDAVAVCR